jgi:hypothetical protein
VRLLRGYIVDSDPDLFSLQRRSVGGFAATRIWSARPSWPRHRDRLEGMRLCRIAARNEIDTVVRTMKAARCGVEWTDLCFGLLITTQPNPKQQLSLPPCHNHATAKPRDASSTVGLGKLCRESLVLRWCHHTPAVFFGVRFTLLFCTIQLKFGSIISGDCPAPQGQNFQKKRVATVVLSGQVCVTTSKNP